MASIDTRTVQGAVEQVIRLMSLVNNASVTPYSNELAVSYLMAAHAHIKDDQEWDECMISHTRTLDGVTGRITQNIEEVRDWKDIKRIYHESMMTPLPKLSTYGNLLLNTNVVGYTGLSRLNDAGPTGYALVQFYPLTLTGQVLFQSAVTFDFNDMNLEAPIDFWAHVYYAAWMFSMDDGTNPAQMERNKASFNVRMLQVKGKQNTRSMFMNPNNMAPNTWWESDDPQWVG